MEGDCATNSDPWKRVIFFSLLAKTKSHCNGFCSHDASRPKIQPICGTNSFCCLFFCFHVAGGCYTLNLRLAFFSGRSSCSGRSIHPHMDNRFNSCGRTKRGVSPTHEDDFSAYVWESLCHIWAFSAAATCIVFAACAMGALFSGCSRLKLLVFGHLC